jgi:hypothetical protein
MIEIHTFCNVHKFGVHLGTMDEARMNLRNTLLQVFTMVEFENLPGAPGPGPGS